MSEKPMVRPVRSMRMRGPERVSCSGPMKGERTPPTTARRVNAPKKAERAHPSSSVMCDTKTLAPQTLPPLCTAPARMDAMTTNHP